MCVHANRTPFIKFADPFTRFVLIWVHSTQTRQLAVLPWEMLTETISLSNYTCCTAASDRTIYSASVSLLIQYSSSSCSNNNAPN